MAGISGLGCVRYVHDRALNMVYSDGHLGKIKFPLAPCSWSSANGFTGQNWQAYY
jgi:hypothetical protein